MSPNINWNQPVTNIRFVHFLASYSLQTQYEMQIPVAYNNIKLIRRIPVALIPHLFTN